jgi:hypothetical protein
MQQISQAMRKVYGYLRAPGAKVPPKWYLYHRHAECLDRINNSQPPAAAGQGKDWHCALVFIITQNMNKTGKAAGKLICSSLLLHAHLTYMSKHTIWSNSLKAFITQQAKLLNSMTNCYFVVFNCFLMELLIEFSTHIIFNYSALIYKLQWMIYTEWYLVMIFCWWIFVT